MRKETTENTATHSTVITDLRMWTIMALLEKTRQMYLRISSSLKMNALWTLSVVKAQVEVLDPGASLDRWDLRDRLEYQATREFRGTPVLQALSLTWSRS